MNVRCIIKVAVDITMFGLMLTLMSYPLTRGLLRHGVCGFLLLAFFICHHFLNISWYRTLGRGSWNVRRCLFTVTDILLLADVALLSASSLAMAGEIFVFMPFPMTSWGRDLHTASAAWCFVLVSFHLGLHGQKFWNRKLQILGRASVIAVLALAIYGGIAFMESGLWSDMLLLERSNIPPANLPQFLTQYIGIALFFCLLACICLRCGRSCEVPNKR